MVGMLYLEGGDAILVEDNFARVGKIREGKGNEVRAMCVVR